MGQMCDAGTSQQRVLLSSAEVPASRTRYVESSHRVAEELLVKKTRNHWHVCWTGKAHPQYTQEYKAVPVKGKKEFEKVRHAGRVASESIERHPHEKLLG